MADFPEDQEWEVTWIEPNGKHGRQVIRGGDPRDYVKDIKSIGGKKVKARSLD